MAQVITMRDPTSASLAECVEELVAWRFEPEEESSLSHAANWLKRLGNDRQFLGDLLVDLISGETSWAEERPAFVGHEANSIVLAPPGRGDFMITAEIWPSAADHALRASGPAALGYGVVHDHNYDFLTLGYFGPGCEIDDYEWGHGPALRNPGASVMLRPVGRSRLEPGRLVHYRSRQDIHCIHPPEALSASLTLSHVHRAHSWIDHHVFESCQRGAGAFRIARVLGHGPSESFLRLAVALVGGEASELARHFGNTHPSDRMRLSAWQALASAATDQAERDEVWHQAEQAGSRAVAEVARQRRGC